MVKMEPMVIQGVPRVWIPPWVEIMLAQLGVREYTDPGASNEMIEMLHGYTTGGPAIDDVPWCSSAMCFGFENAGVISTRSKLAASWKSWGSHCNPKKFGCLWFFGKSDPDAKGSGHVGIGMGISGNEAFCLGGNQNNRWGIDIKKADKIEASRWPAEFSHML